MSLVDLQDVSVSERGLLPQGAYDFMVDEALLKTTKSGTGQYIQLTLVCETPGFEKNKVWANFNIINKSAEAANIGKSQLKKFLMAAGMNPDSLDSVEDLYGKKVSAMIIQTHTPPYDAKNEVKYFIDKNKKSDKANEADVEF